MFKLSEVFGQRGGSDAFGRRAVKNIGIRTDIGQTFAETGTTNIYRLMGRHATFKDGQAPSEGGIIAPKGGTMALEGGSIFLEGGMELGKVP